MTPTVSTPGAVTINVVAVNGAQSFSPNPASLPAGQMVEWHNVDTITHRVVSNDRIGRHWQSRARHIKRADGHRGRRRAVSLFDSSRDGRQRQPGHLQPFCPLSWRVLRLQVAFKPTGADASFNANTAWFGTTTSRRRPLTPSHRISAHGSRESA
jgi:hypothetical protein